jgi:hypothetical protein
MTAGLLIISLSRVVVRFGGTGRVAASPWARATAAKELAVSPARALKDEPFVKSRRDNFVNLRSKKTKKRDPFFLHPVVAVKQAYWI